MSIGLLRWYAPDGTFRRAASHPLKEHFSDTSVQIWNSIRTWQSRLALSRPRHGAGVAFDVTLCPLADYFKDQGVPKLTRHAACNLDYCLARELGVDLIRTQTIAGGAGHCDFGWNFVAYPE